jgi:hypothetical protein
MRIHRLSALAVTYLAAFSVVACSKPAAPAGGAAESAPAASAAQPAAEPASKPIPHACDLLTVKDAEAVFGKGARLVRDSEDTCDLATPSEVGPTVSVKIEPLSDTWDGGETMMTMDKEARKLTDIGDGGYTYMGGSIVFKKGAAEISVITTNYRGALSKLDAARLVATKVAAAM